jgi:hypothetical protein
MPEGSFSALDFQKAVTKYTLDANHLNVTDSNFTRTPRLTRPPGECLNFLTGSELVDGFEESS